MAKQQYKIWLKNLAPGSQYYWGEGTMYVVGKNLLEYFNAICAKTSQFEPEADYFYDPDSSKVQNHELLVYILPSAKQSILAKKDSSVALGQTGSTYPLSTGVISEVYLDVMQGDADLARLAANLIFHEWMHNKLDAYLAGAPLSDVHLQGGEGLATKNAIKNSDRPNQVNIDLMAKHLAKSHAQYTADLSRVSPYP
jgi:hypothetical protein